MPRLQLSHALLVLYRDDEGLKYFAVNHRFEGDRTSLN